MFIFHVEAAGLSLTYIGTLATNGGRYSEWWYTATNPLLKGTAGNNAEVNVKINGTDHAVKADANGNWSYAATMSEGNHAIVLSSQSETYSFTLHTGQNMPSSTTTTSTTQSTAATPDTGSNQLLGVITSITLIGIGGFIYFNSRKNKKAYVSSVLKSLK